MHIYFPPNDVKIEGMENIFIPPMYLIRQNYSNFKISNLKAHIIQQLKKLDIDSFQGKRICITTGSRGIPHMPLIYRTVCDYLRELGASPFLVPAMGSHGGATPEGQLEIVNGYGVTEEAMGCPIKASMETKQIGVTDDGRPVFIDKYASEADGIIMVGRIKAHTQFVGPYESGLMKMAVIGMGKQHGAEGVHEQGFPKMAENLQRYGKVILKNAPIICGIGTIENAFDQDDLDGKG